MIELILHGWKQFSRKILISVLSTQLLLLVQNSSDNLAVTKNLLRACPVPAGQLGNLWIGTWSRFGKMRKPGVAFSFALLRNNTTLSLFVLSSFPEPCILLKAPQNMNTSFIHKTLMFHFVNHLVNKISHFPHCSSQNGHKDDACHFGHRNMTISITIMLVSVQYDHKYNCKEGWVEGKKQFVSVFVLSRWNV